MFTKALLTVAALGMGVASLASVSTVNADGSALEVRRFSTDIGSTLEYGRTNLVSSWTTGAYWTEASNQLELTPSLSISPVGIWEYGQGETDYIWVPGEEASHYTLYFLLDGMTGTGFYRQYDQFYEISTGTIFSTSIDNGFITDVSTAD